MALKRATMAGVAALATVNVWTGCPLLALWVGSRAVGASQLSMTAVVVVLVVLALLEGATLLALAWLTSVYDAIVGIAAPEGETALVRRLCAPPGSPRSRRRAGVTSLEGIVVINVYVAVVTLVVWYLFFAAHPAPLHCAIGC